MPEYALGYRFDIVLRGREATPMETSPAGLQGRSRASRRHRPRPSVLTFTSGLDLALPRRPRVPVLAGERSRIAGPRDRRRRRARAAMPCSRSGRPTPKAATPIRDIGRRRRPAFMRLWPRAHRCRRRVPFRDGQARACARPAARLQAPHINVTRLHARPADAPDHADLLPRRHRRRARPGARAACPHERRHNADRAGAGGGATRCVSTCGCRGAERDRLLRLLSTPRKACYLHCAASRAGSTLGSTLLERSPSRRLGTVSYRALPLTGPFFDH